MGKILSIIGRGLLNIRSLKLTKNTGDTEQNNHTMDASKFQVNFLQLIGHSAWQAKVSFI